LDAFQFFYAMFYRGKAIRCVCPTSEMPLTCISHDGAGFVAEIALTD
jgi:hypothetical protein